MSTTPRDAFGHPAQLRDKAVGVGHKAKTLCSGVFVSGREVEAVLNDVQADDLKVRQCAPDNRRPPRV